MAAHGLLLIILSCIHILHAYDGYSSCAKPYRTSKSHEPPCDFQKQSWCTVPGSAYPWHAVRRFVQENHGLMRRMYGEERHISVLRAEIVSNDVNYMHDNEWKLGESRRTSFRNKAPVTSATTKEQKQEAPSSSTSTEAPQGTTTNTKSTTQNTTQNLKPSPLTTTNFSSKYNTTQHTTVTPASTLLTTTAQDNSTSFIEDSTEDSFMGSSLVPDLITDQIEITTDTVIVTNTHITTTEGTTSTTAQLLKEDVSETMLFQDAQAKHKEQPLPAHRLRGVNACPVKEEVVAPFWANNTRGEVLALLNLYPFEQYVHWEKCTYELKQMYCREGCRCEQQYRLHRLLAYDPNNECRGIFSDWFKFPSCCVCRCYDLPPEFQMTSRSPRTQPSVSNSLGQPPTHWYKKESD
ncbi:protein spaetzle 4-like isoform X2 [Schistocerca americana]|uniref:protein spaetzle 4-like isoform X2 n=2 Tax=Schistocerca americana TaxID=7009 RepID=UPI001F4F1659|nr:protein spaetzle 4-like isoform X2 [Schistocerca americana]